MAQRDTARHINKQFNTLSLEQYEYASVNPEDFKHRLDLAFYKNLQRDLEIRGFLFLDDQENVTLRQRNGTQTFVRYMLSADKSIWAGFYNFVPKLAVRLLMGKPSSKVLDLCTAFSDGTYLCTSNAEAAAKFTYPPAVKMVFLPAATQWDMLLEAHTRSVGNYLDSHPQTTARILNGMADVRRVGSEIQRIKSAFRKQNGLSKAELERLGVGENLDVDEVHAALAEERQRGSD